MRTIIIATVSLLIGISPAAAQEVSVPSVTTASPGGYANPLKLDTDRYDREMRAKNKKRSSSANNAYPQCSADALPAADRARMEAEYTRRARTDGKASADAWVRQEGIRFHARLVKEGKCPR